MKFFGKTELIRTSIFEIAWLFLLTLIVCQYAYTQDREAEPLKLWYDEPAERWEEALPVGNGRIGAMIYGNPAYEEIQLNEETVWAGGPNNNVDPSMKEIMVEIRELLFEGRYVEAQKLANASGTGNNGMPYQLVGSPSFLRPAEGETPVGPFCDPVRGRALLSPGI